MFPLVLLNLSQIFALGVQTVAALAIVTERLSVIEIPRHAGGLWWGLGLGRWGTSDGSGGNGRLGRWRNRSRRHWHHPVAQGVERDEGGCLVQLQLPSP